LKMPFEDEEEEKEELPDYPDQRNLACETLRKGLVELREEGTLKAPGECTYPNCDWCPGCAFSQALDILEAQHRLQKEEIRCLKCNALIYEILSRSHVTSVRKRDSYCSSCYQYHWGIELQKLKDEGQNILIIKKLEHNE